MLNQIDILGPSVIILSLCWTILLPSRFREGGLISIKYRLWFRIINQNYKNISFRLGLALGH